MFDNKRKLNVFPQMKDEIFITNQIDMRFYPDLFKIEFKQFNHQVDRMGEEKSESVIINRRSIGLTPIMMKQLMNIITQVVSNYEKQNGEIKIPEQPKNNKQQVKEVITTSGNYIG